MGTRAGWSLVGNHGVGIECEDGEGSLDAGKGFVVNEPLNALQPGCEFSQGQGAFGPLSLRCLRLSMLAGMLYSGP